MSKPDFRTRSEEEPRLVPGGVDLADSLRPVKDGVIAQEPEFRLRPAPSDPT